MAKKGKIGKQRKDKFYKLAKETGFRSRASFKLIQLNRKFEFLQKSRVLIDLCAAPGGWLQVAHQSMPVSSIIIGVDIVPIRPISNVITLQEDITTDKCRKAIKKELKTWKADTVLHDGAPNVGKSWIYDAFMQNQLTLSALKLATELLVKGGWFITKVFRSKDYLSLVWAFKKLFKRVHVTKPQASRSESAEIFIVCQGYLAPDQIDPKFLDPSHLFKDVVEKSETKSNLQQIIKPKRKAVGYDEDETQYSKLKASEFIFSENHIEKLSKCTEIILDDEDIRDHKLTTEEIKHCCKDIKVLGKGDIRSLLNWRKQLRLAIKGLGSEGKKEELKEIDEEQEIDEAVKAAEDLELSKLQEAKRKKKAILKERRKTHERLNLKMIIKDDEPIIDEDRELFTLSQIRNPKDLSKVEDERNLEFNLEPSQTNIDDLFTNQYRSSFAQYNRETKGNLDFDDENQKEESLYSSDDDLSEDLEFESDEEDTNYVEKTQEIIEGKQNPLVVDLVERKDRVKDTVDKWFDKEDFTNEQVDEDLELDLLAEKHEKTISTIDGSPDKKKQKLKPAEQNTQSTDAEIEVNESDVENKVVTTDENNATKQKSKKKKRVRLDPEGLALGSLIVQSKKMKRDIIENAYNRYASNDENLPDWFVEDEKKHYKKELPVTAEMIREYRQMLKEIDARPIKKVVEAKARKKRKAMRRLEKARKQAEKVTEHPDMSVHEKAEQLKAIYKKALPKENKNVTYVVAKRGAGRKISRPAGVKGRFKVVDKRMKKDARKEKLLMQSTKNKRNMKKNFKKKKAKKN